MATGGHAACSCGILAITAHSHSSTMTWRHSVWLLVPFLPCLNESHYSVFLNVVSHSNKYKETWKTHEQLWCCPIRLRILVTHVTAKGMKTLAQLVYRNRDETETCHMVQAVCVHVCVHVHACVCNGPSWLQSSWAEHYSSFLKHKHFLWLLLHVSWPTFSCFFS